MGRRDKDKVKEKTSSKTETEEYVVEKILDRRLKKGRVSDICLFVTIRITSLLI